MKTAQEKVICPGCDRKFNSVDTMLNHGRSIHWWGEKSISGIRETLNRDHAFDALVEALKLVQKLMQDNNTVSPHALCSYNDEDTILDQINEALRLAKGE